MRKFEDLVKEGYKGGDASLETSLFEYGLIWKEDKKDITFIFGVGFKDEGCNLFDWGTVEKNVDPKKEWDWANFADVCKFTGQTEEEFFANPLHQIVSDLLSYYSFQDVFGEAYYPFEIEMED